MDIISALRVLETARGDDSTLLNLTGSDQAILDEILEATVAAALDREASECKLQTTEAIL
jgi:hypothetical protein